MAHPNRDPFFSVVGGEARQHSAALLQQDPGPSPIGRCGKAGEFDGAGKAQPGIHRRGNELTVGVGGRDARHDLRVVDHQVIATLGFERDTVAE